MERKLNEYKLSELPEVPNKVLEAQKKSRENMIKSGKNPPKGEYTGPSLSKEER